MRQPIEFLLGFFFQKTCISTSCSDLAPHSMSQWELITIIFKQTFKQAEQACLDRVRKVLLCLYLTYLIFVVLYRCGTQTCHTHLIKTSGNCQLVEKGYVTLKYDFTVILLQPVKISTRDGSILILVLAICLISSSFKNVKYSNICYCMILLCVM